MPLSSRTTVSLILAAAFAASAHAQSGLTREQVQAELAQAQRAGTLPVGGEIGFAPRQWVAQPSTLTRAQVLREFERARTAGELVADGESGLRMNEVNPGAYPHAVVAAGRTRAEVQAELREAVRTGDMVANGESGLLLRDAFPQQYAKARAAKDSVMQAASPAGPGGQ
ncbi:MAG: DUF4148 domain-containing protein [Ramlibacter sp.]